MTRWTPAEVALARRTGHVPGRTRAAVERKLEILDEQPSERAARMGKAKRANQRRRGTAYSPLWHGRCPAFRPRYPQDEKHA